MGAGETCVAILFLIWFALSIPSQFHHTRLGTAVTRRNLFGLLPGWTFFAPTPGTADYRFVCRDISQDGVSDWIEIPWCSKRRALDGIWHPRRYRTKLIVDCINSFNINLRELQKAGLPVEQQTQTWTLTVAYMALLNIAMKMPRNNTDSYARQFAIVEQLPSDPAAPARLLLLSARHRFDDPVEQPAVEQLN